MPENDVINEERTSAEPSAEGSAKEEWLPTKEASQLSGASARTLKRRADAGAIRRTSLYGKFGLETLYRKEDVEKLKKDLERSAKGFADAIAEAKIRVAEGKFAEGAGGDKGGHFLAEANKIISQNFSKLSEPFFRLADVLERGFQAQTKMIEAQREIEERGFRTERIKNIVWPVLVVVLIGGIYYGFARLASYYKDELRVREEELGLREKEIGLLDGVYNRLLEKHEEDLGRKDMEIEKLKGEAGARDGVSTERMGE